MRAGRFIIPVYSARHMLYSSYSYIKKYQVLPDGTDPQVTNPTNSWSYRSILTFH